MNEQEQFNTQCNEILCKLIDITILMVDLMKKTKPSGDQSPDAPSLSTTSPAYDPNEHFPPKKQSESDIQTEPLPPSVHLED